MENVAPSPVQGQVEAIRYIISKRPYFGRATGSARERMARRNSGPDFGVTLHLGHGIFLSDSAAQETTLVQAHI